MVQAVLIAGASASAAIAGASASVAFVRWRDMNERHRTMLLSVRGSDDALAGLHVKGLAAQVLSMLYREERAVAYRDGGLPAALEKVGVPGIEAALLKAGFEQDISVRAVQSLRWRLTVLAAAAGCVIGAVFSAPLAVLLCVVGAWLGFASVGWAIRSEAKERTHAVERSLPEMIDVVMLGLRSGLSFDRAFALYHQSFAGGLAQSAARAQRQWEFGFMTREEALRHLAASYESQTLTRAVEGIVRSLRFGTTLSDVLDSIARESRELYRTQMQEQVAKAPVRMMLPVGTLILPAMLLLVLGPVLLELVQGF